MPMSRFSRESRPGVKATGLGLNRLAEFGRFEPAVAKKQNRQVDRLVVLGENGVARFEAAKVGCSPPLFWFHDPPAVSGRLCD